MPARITLPAVGACTCASGNQVCNGKSGTLIAKPAKSAMNTANCQLRVIGLAASASVSAGIEKVNVGVAPAAGCLNAQMTIVSSPRNVSTLPARV